MILNQVKKRIFNNENAKVVISSNYGKRSYMYNGKMVTDFHYGIDYATYGKNLPLYPITNGIVYATGKDSVSGNYIFIKYPALGIMSFYCHMKNKPLVKKGDKVSLNTKVGYVGTTGHSTGEHLHLGIKMINTYSPLSLSSWVDPAKVRLKFKREIVDDLNLRKKPGIKEEKLIIIPKGEKVSEVIRNYKRVNGYLWDKIKYNDIQGYIANEYLK